MDYSFEKKWKETLAKASSDFGDDLDLSSVLLLIGLQESNQSKKRFSKDEKINLMHVAICTLLEPLGFYEYKGVDEDKWPHFERVDALPELSPVEQDNLVRRAIIDYFEPKNLV